METTEIIDVNAIIEARKEGYASAMEKEIPKAAEAAFEKGANRGFLEGVGSAFVGFLLAAIVYAFLYL